MSQLSQLKDRVSSLGRQSKASGEQLGQFSQSFSQQISEVEQLIGGSATSTDRKVIEALNQAKPAVNSAVQALNGAGQTAEQYSNQI